MQLSIFMLWLAGTICFTHTCNNLAVTIFTEEGARVKFEWMVKRLKIAEINK